MAYSSTSTESYGYYPNGHVSARPNAPFEVQVYVPPISTLQQQHQVHAAYQPQPQNAPSNFYPPQQQLAYHPPPRSEAPHLPPASNQAAANYDSANTVNGAGTPVDYQVLLLSLAEDYLDAAHGRGAMVALATRASEVEQYKRLISFGLGCLETVLKSWRLQPRLEARVLLRYATVLHEETENDLEAETALSKGITLCERNRLLDLKYSMQYLLARVMYKTSRKASLKYLDGVIQDVEALQHIAWIYAFRFLRVSLSLKGSSSHDVHTALFSLRSLSATARDFEDTAIFGLSSALEAITHLRSSAVDSAEQAQRALAAARSIQLNEATGQFPQLRALILFLDLSCSLQECNVTQAALKSQTMRAVMDHTFTDSHWRKDGSFSVPMNFAEVSNGASIGPASLADQTYDGVPRITFTWLPARDIYALAYFLCGVTMRPKNAFDHRKAEEYLREGIKQVGETYKTHDQGLHSVSFVASLHYWRKELECYMRLHLAFAFCARTDWTSALSILQDLQVTANELGSGIPEPLSSLILYLTGTIHQGTGNVAAALEIYQHPLLALRLQGNAPAQNYSEIAIIAALNSILILREPSHPSHRHVETLISTVEPLCLHHANKNIVSAYQLIRATAINSSIIKTKECLQLALNHAKSVANHQLTCITLNFMSWKFFRGVISEQAEKSAKAATTLARKGHDSLWTSVADGMLANTLEVQGRFAEAEATKQQAVLMAQVLPPAMQRTQTDR
ncbi:MAG: hypothetical protein M1812_003812 [Candelaria pacifica]|nr:MAG: hypothetical protein M1812_003812 [Candelaria pacifica]